MQLPSNLTDTPKKRGRPFGSKNKPKQPVDNSPQKAVKRGHPKVNSPQEAVKLTRSSKLTKGQAKIAWTKVVAEETEQDKLQAHTLFTAAKWLEKHMHPSELQHYRGRANRKNVPILHEIVADILGFFNAKDEALLKFIHKNNSIVNYSNGLHSKTSELS